MQVNANSFTVLFYCLQDQYLLIFLRQFFIHSLLTISMVSIILIPLKLPADNTKTHNSQAQEYLLKAAFLYNFARLIDWPENTFKHNSDPFRLCLIGNDPFGAALESLHNKKVRGHPLTIQRHLRLNNIDQCQMLFISRQEEEQIPTILKTINHAPTLTISEVPLFAEKSGHIRFFLNNNKLSLEVNLNAINQSGLKISSRILSLAKIVSSEETTQ